MLPTTLLRIVRDERLARARVRCPDDGKVLVPTGAMFSEAGSRHWSLAFRCIEHSGEVLRIWQPELQLLVDEVLQGVDVDALPWVDLSLIARL